MELSAEKKESLAILAGHGGRIRWSMELDRADSRAGNSGGADKSATPEEIVIHERRDNFSAAIGGFLRDFYDSGLMDRDYAQTIESLGGGRSGHELAANPDGCDLRLTLALLTFLVRADRYVWGFWDSQDNREKLVRLLFRLRVLLEGRVLP